MFSWYEWGISFSEAGGSQGLEPGQSGNLM